MKTAIVADLIVNLGGAEKVLQEIHRMIPRSDVFTLVKNQESVNTLLGNVDVTSSFIQKFPKAEKIYQLCLPLLPLALKRFNLKKYDVVISSSFAVAKSANTFKNQLHICYCHTPIRYAWDLHDDFVDQSSGMMKLVKKQILKYIKRWDKRTSTRPDYYVANSKNVANRIKEYYGIIAKVIHPPVDTNRFQISTNRGEYFLVVSRLVFHKRVEMIVKAFNILGLPLVVIGDGNDFEHLKSIANENVQLLGRQPDEVVTEYMQNARAFVFAANEDFGIAPVEAQSCGVPVIAYGKGGVLETVVEGETGVFYAEKTPESLMAGIQRFIEMEEQFDPQTIRKNAERFSTERFKQEFSNYLSEKQESHRRTLLNNYEKSRSMLCPSDDVRV